VVVLEGRSRSLMGGGRAIFVEKHVIFDENRDFPLKAGLVGRRPPGSVISRSESRSMQTSDWGHLAVFENHVF